MMYLAGEFRYISIADSDKIKENAEEVSKMLSGFIKKIS